MVLVGLSLSASCLFPGLALFGCHGGCYLSGEGRELRCLPDLIRCHGEDLIVGQRCGRVRDCGGVVGGCWGWSGRGDLVLMQTDGGEPEAV